MGAGETTTIWHFHSACHVHKYPCHVSEPCMHNVHLVLLQRHLIEPQRHPAFPSASIRMPFRHSTCNEPGNASTSCSRHSKKHRQHPVPYTSHTHSHPQGPVIQYPVPPVLRWCLTHDVHFQKKKKVHGTMFSKHAISLLYNFFLAATNPP